LGGVGVPGLVDHGERDVLQRTVHRVAEDQQVDDREHHRRDEEHGLAPQRQEGALADREDAQHREEGSARGTALPPAPPLASGGPTQGYASRSARRVYATQTS